MYVVERKSRARGRETCDTKEGVGGGKGSWKGAILLCMEVREVKTEVNLWEGLVEQARIVCRGIEYE